MEREPVRQSQSDHGNATNGAGRINTPSTTTIGAAPTPTPTPPRLTPNPTLLDSAHPAQTATSSPPPPPLTPAPSLSASHVPKAVAAAAAVAGAPPPHIQVPAPPRLTTTGTPILRTYSRPILPSPMGAAKMSSSSPVPAILALSSSSSLRLPARAPLASSVSSSSSSPTVASAPPPLPFSPAASSSSASPSVAHGDAAAPPQKSPAVLTNGNARPTSTHTSAAITPFHTPASPPGRQVTQALGTPGPVRANQIPTPVRQRVSQQALLLGKGLKGSGQDQALLRAQMLILTSAMRTSPSSSSRPSSSSTPSSHPASAQLQSLTLRPPPPGTLTIPPSLRLKRPVSSSAPPPLSRGRCPLFPPLRPRPQPAAMATESLAMTIRPHLSVPPPTLYSPVRAVPLRPRLHSPNGHSGAPPRQSPALQPITASAPAHTSQAPPVNRHLVALKACPLSQANQSQHAALSMAASTFERSPSAARQLQIIALSSGRQSQQGNGVHAAHASVQSAPSTTAETPEPGGQSQRTLGSGDTPPLLHQPLNPSMPKTTSSSSPPLSSPPSLLCPSSPGGPPFGSAAPQTHGLLVRQGEKQGVEEQREKGRDGVTGGPRCGGGDEDVMGKDMRVNVRDDQRGAEAKEEEEEEEERKVPASSMKAIVTDPQEQRSQPVTDQEERMEVTEEGERERERTVGDEKEEEQGRESPMDQAENLTVRSLHRHQNSEPDNPEPNSHPATIQNSLPELKAVTPSLVATSSVPELSAQSQRLAEAQREPISHEDLCENMSTQSDNQSALSSLSSQSPPSSPFIAPSSDRTPFPPPASAHPAHPANLSPPRHRPDDIAHSQEEAEKGLGQSEDESEGNEHWAPRPWPEGRQVLTHLVEGFVIQEGLQPFPVKRTSLLVDSQQSATTPPEVNGTNGTAVFPETQQLRPERSAHSTDTDEGEGGATDDAGGTNSGQKDKVVLHCQFCGKRGHAHNFMRSKRFCSTSCARGFNVRLTKRLRALSAGSRPERPRPALQRAESVPGKPLLLRLSRDSLQPRVLWTATRREAEEKEEEEEEKDGEEADEEEPAVVVTTKAERRGAARRTRRTASEPAMTTTTAAPTTPTTPTTTYKPVPAHWSVEEVTTFIHTLPGCSEVAEAFRVQEIDGQALLLLTEDHLMTSMNIKLGPALKICAHINALKHQ